MFTHFKLLVYISSSTS